MPTSCIAGGSWRARASKGQLAKLREFVAVAIAPQAVAHGQARGDIEVELRRGAVTMKVIWPVAAAVDFAAWARELLR